jgi:HPt (histidine-containing phosphotransfer) domain-containing protein
VNEDIVIPEEIREKYLLRRKNDIEALKLSQTKKSMDDFKRIGHQLKGNAASFGYFELEKIAISMEGAAVRGDTFEAGRQLQLFELWLAQQNLKR